MIKRKSIGWAATAIMVGAAGLFGWALLWPQPSCSHPSCARQRFTIDIEVDALQPVQPIAFEVQTDNGRVSLQSIMAAGGIDLKLVLDQLDVPYSEASGALDRADLYQFAQAWYNRNAATGADASIYALLTTALVSDTGEPLFGIMFDVAGREGLAVAPATTERSFGPLEPAQVATLQLRTFAHELLHTLNRHHVDATLTKDGRLTLEAPTRCISGQHQRQWFLTEQPLMAISASTIRFFQTADSRDVLPGKQNSPLQLQRISPTECEDLRASPVIPAETRWTQAVRRLQRLFSIQTAMAAEAETETDAESKPEPEPDAEALDEAPDPQPASIDLRVQAQAAAYPLGYPLAVRIIARNLGEEAVPLKDRLHPGYGMVWFEVRGSDDSQWQVLKPLAWFEPVDDEAAMLAPGEQTDQTVPIYFGDTGWTFTEPGEYQLRARLQTGDDDPEIISTETTLKIVAPETDDERGVLQPLLDENQRLDPNVGRLLTFGGRIGAEDAIEPLETAVEKFGHTALGSALRLTLISQRLRPAIDPRTGTRPEPDLSGARELLEDTCTDSGIAALKHELLQRHANSMPAAMSHDMNTSAAAWDGTMATPGETVATYSDPSLRAVGSSLHFCFNEASLRGPTRAAVTRIARQLRREQPRRLVIVGHGDSEGSCRYNDKLSLRRADAVRRALISAGVRKVVMQTASLGERRPLDFSSTSSAHDLNRRVDILVESDVDPTPAAAEHVVPRCPARVRRDL